MRFTSLVLALCLVGAIAPSLRAQEANPEAEPETPTETPTETTTEADPPDAVTGPEADPEPTDSEPDPQPPANNTRTLVGQCRMTNRQVSIFSIPSVGSDSSVVATVAPETRLTLASNGANGWIQISKPAEGHVIARYLTTCPDTTVTPTPTSFPFAQHPTLRNLSSGACRAAIVDLAIRPEPRQDARPFIGSVKEGQTMTLTGASQMGDEYRLWLRISKPYPGWVSGGVEGGTNLDFCS